MRNCGRPWKSVSAGLSGLLGSAIVSTLLAAGCSRPAPPPEEQAAVPVEVTVIVPASMNETTVLTGVLEGYRAVDIVSEVAGEFVSIQKDLGDRVGAEEVLAIVDPKIPRESLNQAEAGLMAADAAYEVAQVDFKRDSTLYHEGTSSEAVYARSRLAMTAAKAEVHAARATRELAARQLANTEIRAPFAGVISRRDCEIGSYAAPGMTAFRIVDIDSLRLRLGVSQTNVVRIRPGMSVHITVDALDGRVFVGRIRAVSPEADEMTRTFAVEVIIANPEGHPLKGGLVVRVALILDAHSNILVVPRESVLRQGMGAFVFVVQDSLARKREIQLGSLIDNHYVIEDGLLPGDRVVTVGMQNLREGMRVLIEAPGGHPQEQKELSS